MPRAPGVELIETQLRSEGGEAEQSAVFAEIHRTCPRISQSTTVTTAIPLALLVVCSGAALVVWPLGDSQRPWPFVGGTYRGIKNKICGRTDWGSTTLEVWRPQLNCLGDCNGNRHGSCNRDTGACDCTDAWTGEYCDIPPSTGLFPGEWQEEGSSRVAFVDCS